MLGWFKKKFSRNDSQEHPVPEDQVVEDGERVLSDEATAAGDGDAENRQPADETPETGVAFEQESDAEADAEIQERDDRTAPADETGAAAVLAADSDTDQEQVAEVGEETVDDELFDVDFAQAEQSGDTEESAQAIACSEKEPVEEKEDTDEQLEADAASEKSVTEEKPASDTFDAGLDDILDAAEESFQLPSSHEENAFEGDSGITHVNVEELEFVEESAPEPDSETDGTRDDVTVVATEDLEFFDADGDAEQTGQEQGEIPEEILREIFPAPPPVEQDKPQRLSMFQRLQDRLGKTRDSFVHRLDALLLGKKEIDQELLDDLEEILITADLGVSTTMELLDAARDKVKRNELSDPQALKGVLRDKILSFLQESDQPAELVMPESGPFVIMVVGVNGVGKTTTIGKIASKFVDSGQSVLLVAGDTFRAAAIDQLKIWGDRVGVEVVAGEPGCDPSSVVFDGVARGVAEDVDVVLIDTAGRLHTSVNLMEELKKIRRVIGKNLDTAPHEVMLVLDATTGQNAISQAKFFNEAVHVTGLAVTKLDGTAKGGIVANVCRELQIPVRFIGIGEQVDDLRDFDPEEFVQALFSQSEEDAVAA
ncbi:MAG: signal recognition particle-docking protein FtsY [Desulfobulbus sp.]|nr:MAG: signal recognition particle-docking protein FtsY [Desulfobulbus sp.]